MRVPPREPIDSTPDEPRWSSASDATWYPPESAEPSVQAGGSARKAIVVDAPAKSALDGFLLLAGAGFVVAGSFLPWAKITAVLVGTITKSGTDGGDGWLTMLLAVPLAIFGFRKVCAAKAAIPRAWSLVFALALGALAVFEIQNATSRVNTANAAVGVYGHAAVGVGLWMLLLGSALGIVGSLVAFRQRNRGSR